VALYRLGLEAKKEENFSEWYSQVRYVLDAILCMFLCALLDDALDVLSIC